MRPSSGQTWTILTAGPWGGRGLFWTVGSGSVKVNSLLRINFWTSSLRGKQCSISCPGAF